MPSEQVLSIYDRIGDSEEMRYLVWQAVQAGIDHLLIRANPGRHHSELQLLDISEEQPGLYSLSVCADEPIVQIEVKTTNASNTITGEEIEYKIFYDLEHTHKANIIFKPITNKKIWVSCRLENGERMSSCLNLEAKIQIPPDHRIAFRSIT